MIARALFMDTPFKAPKAQQILKALFRVGGVSPDIVILIFRI